MVFRVESLEQKHQMANCWQLRHFEFNVAALKLPENNTVSVVSVYVEISVNAFVSWDVLRHNCLF